MGNLFALAGRGKDSVTGFYAILVKIGLYLQSLEEAGAPETGHDAATSVKAEWQTLISQQAEWKPLITHPEQGAGPAGLPGLLQYTSASVSVLWVLTVQLPMSWELKDEQLAQGSAKGGPAPDPAVISVLHILVTHRMETSVGPNI